MRASPSRLLLLALVVGCGTRDDAAFARSADSTRPAAVPAFPPAGSPAAGDTLCATMAATAGRALAIAFVRDSGSAFPSPRGSGPPWRGCRVRGNGTVRPYSAVSAMPEQKLRAAMRGTGWVEETSFEASGPEGSAFALRRGPALCRYDILFPGAPGDDDSENDSAAPPAANAPPLPYVVHIFCTPSAPPRGG